MTAKNKGVNQHPRESPRATTKKSLKKGPNGNPYGTPYGTLAAYSPWQRSSQYIRYVDRADGRNAFGYNIDCPPKSPSNCTAPMRVHSYVYCFESSGCTASSYRVQSD